MRNNSVWEAYAYYKQAISSLKRSSTSEENKRRQSETFGGPTNVYPAFLSICGYNWGMLGNFKEAIPLCERGLSVSEKIANSLTVRLCE